MPSPIFGQRTGSVSPSGPIILVILDWTLASRGRNLLWPECRFGGIARQIPAITLNLAMSKLVAGFENLFMLSRQDSDIYLAKSGRGFPFQMPKNHL